MAPAISNQNYLEWYLRICFRWITCRELRRLNTTLFLAVVFFVFYTMLGILQSNEAYNTGDIPSTLLIKTTMSQDLLQIVQPDPDFVATPSPETSKFSTTFAPRDPDPLSLLLVHHIHSKMTPVDQKKFANRVHRNPGLLLSPEHKESQPDSDEDFKKYKMDLLAKALEENQGTSPKTPTLCVNSPDSNARLGNMMFMYASTFSLAKDSHHNLSMDAEFRKLKTIFPKVEFESRQMKDTGAIIMTKYASHQKLNLPPTDICIMGYLQSWKYFAKHSATLRKHFTFTDSIVTRARKQLSEIATSAAGRQGVSPQDVTLIGMHVRRGDMLSHLNQRQGYRVPKASYYYKAMLYFYAMYPQAHYVVVSDDPQWCRTMFQGMERAVTVLRDVKSAGRHADPVVDLAVLSQCNHTIASVGTFSWWGAWLAQGGVVYYDQPLEDESPMSQGFAAQDYFMPYWKAMGD